MMCVFCFNNDIDTKSYSWFNAKQKWMKENHDDNDEKKAHQEELRLLDALMS